MRMRQLSHHHVQGAFHVAGQTLDNPLCGLHTCDHHDKVIGIAREQMSARYQCLVAQEGSELVRQLAGCSAALRQRVSSLRSSAPLAFHPMVGYPSTVGPAQRDGRFYHVWFSDWGLSPHLQRAHAGRTTT